jgi:hypothetical protein
MKDVVEWGSSLKIQDFEASFVAFLSTQTKQEIPKSFEIIESDITSHTECHMDRKTGKYSVPFVVCNFVLLNS